MMLLGKLITAAPLRFCLQFCDRDLATECRPVQGLEWLPPIKNPSVWLRTA
ncbi:MAG: hypothetical protein JGK26_13495 [Microcoleus sp. PH2017_27_LUM_O_A]|uniref:hypothetical protein n=1 Tax=unclassified Microcoleus TaxID=2642155 RepID=UPI001DA510F8|nr:MULTISPECIES: hypothetical protein [unclassified Microcoleus]MCC3560119.1 hypothetical protein [Microcoleus sp. PH2017_27_LUM_O_A]